MLLKQRTKHGKKSGRKPVADQVRAMAASGLVEDQIALRLGIDKNELRARYEWLSRGGHFVCAGRNSNFSPERLQKFATVKAAAQKLLKQHANGRPQQRG